MAASGQSDKKTSAQVKVWDLPTRLFHWLLVALIVVSWYTGQGGNDRMLKFHFWSGYAILTLIIFRIFWGILGSTHSRFSDFIKGPGPILHHIRDLFSRDAPADRGHNPVGGLMVVAILTLLALQVGTGLFANDDIFTTGPLADHVSEATQAKLTTIHKININLIWVLIAAHVVAILAYLAIKRQNLVRAMITGRKPADTVGQTARFTSNWVALILLVVAAAIVWFIVTYK